jgi:hypothetical protein
VCFGPLEKAVFRTIIDLGLVDRQDMGIVGELVVVEILVCSGVLCYGIHFDLYRYEISGEMKSTEGVC